MSYSILNILRKANEMEDKDKMVDYLKENLKYPLELYFAAVYNPSIEFENFKKLEYKKSRANKPGFADSYIEHQIKRLYVYQPSYPIPYEKKREILIKSIELMCEEEQELFLHILRKENVFRNITKPIVKKVCPHALSPDYVLRRP